MQYDIKPFYAPRVYLRVFLSITLWCIRKNALIMIGIFASSYSNYRKLKRLDTYYQIRQGSPGNVGIMGFVFTNFQADNYGTSSGDDEEKCVYN